MEFLTFRKKMTMNRKELPTDRGGNTSTMEKNKSEENALKSVSLLLHVYIDYVLISA